MNETSSLMNETSEGERISAMSIHETIEAKGISVPLVHGTSTDEYLIRITLINETSEARLSTDLQSTKPEKSQAIITRGACLCGVCA